PLATSASHPSAAMAILSNAAAVSSAARRGTSAAGGAVAACTSERTGRPNGTSGTPTSASRSAQSGGAHIRTSAPSSRGRTASPISGSTPPRESYVDSNTRTSRPPLSADFWPRPAIMRHDPGLAASPPVRYRLKVERSGPLLFSLIIRGGRAPSSCNAGAPHTAIPPAFGGYWVYSDGAVIGVAGALDMPAGDLGRLLTVAGLDRLDH